MLVKWEDNDAEVRQLWSLMNGWVFDGFKTTYEVHTILKYNI
jgi:arginyl-tRNA synthetase